MKIRFKQQNFQTEAVKAIADCFAGQPRQSMQKYRIDPGKTNPAEAKHYKQVRMDAEFLQSGFRNQELVLAPHQLLHNINTVQRSFNLDLSPKLVTTKVCNVNLDVEMETGTRKDLLLHQSHVRTE